MLDQSAAMLHVQNLQAPANCEQGQVALERFRDQGCFQSVALVVGRFGLRMSLLAVPLRVHIPTACQQQAGKPVQRYSPANRRQDGFHSGRVHGRLIRSHFGEITIHYQHPFAHCRMAGLGTKGAIRAVSRRMRVEMNVRLLSLSLVLYVNSVAIRIGLGVTSLAATNTGSGAVAGG